MIKVICAFCRKSLKKPGALIFSPPFKRGLVLKFHMCRDCWETTFGITPKPERGGE